MTPLNVFKFNFIEIYEKKNYHLLPKFYHFLHFLHAEDCAEIFTVFENMF